MENDIVTVGTKTNTNGQELTGQAGFKVNGQDVSILGDTASCNCGSKSCRKTGPIIQNSPRNIAFNGVMLAKQGDLVDTGCGQCFILPSEHKVSLGTQMASNIRIFDGVKFGDNVRINHVAPNNISQKIPLTLNQVVNNGFEHQNIYYIKDVQMFEFRQYAVLPIEGIGGAHGSYTINGHYEIKDNKLSISALVSGIVFKGSSLLPSGSTIATTGTVALFINNKEIKVEHLIIDKNNSNAFSDDSIYAGSASFTLPEPSESIDIKLLLDISYYVYSYIGSIYSIRPGFSETRCSSTIL